VYNLIKNGFLLSKSTILVNYALVLTPVCGNIIYPLKLQYWHPIWNYWDSTWNTWRSGFFLLIN